MSDQNKLTGKELGIYLGILCGIAFLQATEQLFGLVVCPLFGFVLGMLLDNLTKQISFRRGWLEEE